jgi:hypothetical protein
MGVTRQDLIRSGRYLEVSDEEWAAELATRQFVIDRYMENDTWAVKIKKNVGILLTASVSGKPFLKASVESHMALGYWLILSYDNFIDPSRLPDISYENMLPPKDVMVNVDTFLIPHHQTWGGVSYPYMWQLRLASGIFSQFEYVLCDNGDTILEKPENFPKMLEELGDADILSTGPVNEREVGTCGLLMRSAAFIKVAKHMIDNVVPFEEYERTTQDFGNTEGRLAVAVKDLGLKVKVVTPGFNEQLHVPGGFWYETVGFRHIHGEYNYAYRYKKIPPHYKYFDPRYTCDYEQIKKYWDTQDMSILENWWAKY